MVPRFRAWDKEENLWIKVASLVFDEEGEMWYLGPVMDDFNPVYYENELGKTWEIMQSTGLKDKNGVEIFEADVVKVSDGSNEEDSYFSVVKNYADEGYPAFDIEAPSSWNYESNILAAIMGGEYETIEIIGNIYENPELLEQADEN
ncbi:YopX family protein [Enterococcus gallinarum]|uniref:YopX family protein n=1 Tax=Enterococcus gallinarum TaxID=1353 RepID=UPI0039A5A5E6